jgi:hypothetical protein
VVIGMLKLRKPGKLRKQNYHIWRSKKFHTTICTYGTFADETVDQDVAGSTPVSHPSKYGEDPRNGGLFMYMGGIQSA